MITYIYFVKCPNCEDEHFDFFDDAKGYAMGCLSQKPIITQTEVNRNDFGECTDHCDLGTVWSWEDAVGKETDAEPTVSIFTKDNLKHMADGKDPEFDSLDNSVDFEPETSEALLDEDLEYEFKPTELQKAKAEVFKLSGIQRFKEDETLPQIYALYKELAAADPEGRTSVTSGLHTTAEDFLDFYRKFHELRKNRELYISHYDAENRDLLTGAASVKFKSAASKDKLTNEAFTKTNDNFRKPIPEGMTIEQLVEAMEENEDEVECVGCEELHPKTECTFDKEIGWVCPDCEDRIVKCTWCEDLFDKSECRYEVNLGWLCSRCEAAIKSRGETLTFKENNYWDFLDEDLQELSFSDMVADSINHLTNDLGKDPMSDDFADLVIKDIEDNYDVDFPDNPEDYRAWASEVASEVSRQLNNQLDEDIEPEELHDLGNTYDGGYPTDKPELPEEDEIPEVSDSHLRLCPECGKETFDIETGICVECGFN